MAKAKTEVSMEQLAHARKGRRVAVTINEKGRTRVQLASTRKGGDNFETLTIKLPDPEPDLPALDEGPLAEYLDA